MRGVTLALRITVFPACDHVCAIAMVSRDGVDLVSMLMSISSSAEEAFTGGVIRRTSLTRHRTDETSRRDASQPTQPAVMAPSVAVYHRPVTSG